jgi:hypothetical protein
MKRIIDAAIAAGVKLYFANEFVGYVTSPQFERLPDALMGAKFRMRAELEKRGKMGKEDGGLGEMKWTALNGGPFFDMCKLNKTSKVELN